MTLSIKNTAGALYKSQIKGENRILIFLQFKEIVKKLKFQDLV